jgi:hypothetical protein
VAQNEPARAGDHRLAEHVLRPIVYHSKGEREAGVIHRLISFFSPLQMMKDVSRGSFEERMAAYRHNRSMRGPLAACMRRWALCSSVAMVLTGLFDALGSGGTGPLNIFVLLAAACGTFIACAVCMLFVMGYAYVYLTHNDW